jgi:hypothetical protein
MRMGCKSDVIEKIKSLLDELDDGPRVCSAYAKYNFIFHDSSVSNCLVLRDKDGDSEAKVNYACDYNIHINLEQKNFTNHVIYNCAGVKDSKIIGYIINWFLEQGYCVKSGLDNSWILNFKKECC